MIIRALDTNHDWTFGIGKNNYLSGELAIEQNIQTRLMEFFSDCFFNMTAGVDWIRLLGSMSTEQEIILSCRAVILQSFGVVRVNSISPSLNGRGLTIHYNIDTIYTSQFTQNLEIINA